MRAEETGHELVAGEDLYLPTLVFKLARDLRTAIERELDEQGITMQQAALLLLANRYGGHVASRLAGPLGTDAAGLTRLVDRLVAKGLVVRESSPQDRRAVVIQLTGAGQALLPGLVRAFQQTQAHVVEGLSEAEVADLRERLLGMREKLRAAAGETAP